MAVTLLYLALTLTFTVAVSFQDEVNVMQIGETLGSFSDGNRIQIGNITTITNSSRPARSTWCDLQWHYGDILSFSTPDYGIQNYPNNAECYLYGGGYPMMSEFTLKPFKLQPKQGGVCKDYFEYTFPYGVTKRWCGTQKKKFKTPSYGYVARFYSDDTITRPGFNISIRLIYDSPCHLYYTLTYIGQTVEFSTPNYPDLDTMKNRKCEVWVYNCYGRVQVDFLDFDLNPPCKKNNAVVNLYSDDYYPQSTSTRHCGTTLPPSMTSAYNYAMIVYQAKKKNKGFRVRFTAVNY